MTFSEAWRLAEARGHAGNVEKRPARWPVGKEHGGRFGMPRKRVIAVLGPISGRPSKMERNYQWVVEVKISEK